MRAFFYMIVSFMLFSDSLAQSWKFDLGEGAPAKGYTKVTTNTKFNYTTGFGFDQGSVVRSVKRKGNDPLRCDYITSDKAFYFSVKIPEGNYDVKIILGDKEGSSATTVRAENRRLFLPNIRTRKGEIVEKFFTVHVRDSVIKDSAGKAVRSVRLKPREISYLHWDNLLTIELMTHSPKFVG